MTHKVFALSRMGWIGLIGHMILILLPEPLRCLWYCMSA